MILKPECGCPSIDDCKCLNEDMCNECVTIKILSLPVPEFIKNMPYGPRHPLYKKEKK